LFPEIRKALLEMNLDEAVAKLLGEESVQVNVGGKTLEILPDEVEVRAEAKTGMTVSQEGAYLAAIKTDLTDDLIAEGLAREFVRRVQDFRKQAGFDIADRIRLYYSASVKLTKAIEAHREYIMGEVLATQIEDKKPTKKAQCPDEMFQFEGEEVTIGIMKN
jgi:isoleucyl-tRNA synthetase